MPIKEYLEKKEKYTTKKLKEDKCKIHSSFQNQYISYCFDCKIHLCIECLKSRIHINHNKNYLIEIQPTEDELGLIEEVTKDYKRCIENLNEEKIISLKNLENWLNMKKIDENKKLKNKLEENENNLEKKLFINKSKFINDINEIIKRYEDEIKLRKNIFETENIK